MMTGIGDRLGPPVACRALSPFLVNPGIAAPTKQVFEALGLAHGSRCQVAYGPRNAESECGV